MTLFFLRVFVLIGIVSTSWAWGEFLNYDGDGLHVAYRAILTLVLYLYARDKYQHQRMALHHLSEAALLMYHRMKEVGDIYEFPRKYLDEAKELEKMALAERQIFGSNTIYLKRTR